MIIKIDLEDGFYITTNPDWAFNLLTAKWGLNSYTLLSEYNTFKDQPKFANSILKQLKL